jgi:opacity protein-like surface antigen
MVRKSLTASRVLALLAVSAPAIAQYQMAQPGDTPPPQTPAVRTGEHLYLEPKNGQSQEQQWSDRYACHNWAKSQSGFDPTKSGADVPSDENGTRREQYRRAMTACLEGRGYSVRYGAPPPNAPPVSYPPPPPRATAIPVQHFSPPVSELKYHPIAVQIEGGGTVTTGTTNKYLDDGSNVGLGLTWFPTSVLPLGLRVDGSYSTFRETNQSLFLASQATGTNVSWGHANLYGGDLDAELDLRMGPSVKEYFFGGAGRYREQTELRQFAFESGVVCYFHCFEGRFPFAYTVARNTSDWLNSWNAGVGFEFALTDPASFFVEARYLRVGPASNKMEFVPIRVGLRF